MNARLALSVAAAVIVACAAAAFQFVRAPAADLAEPIAQVHRYCVDCHNDAELAGGLSFEHLRADGARADAATWERILTKLGAGAMPPYQANQPRPEPAQIDRLIAGVEEVLDRTFEQTPEIYSPSIRRLNTTEYANAIRDLLGVEVDTSEFLPPDRAVEGFDNIADALSVSPALLEGYLAASADIASVAVGHLGMRAETVTYRTKPDASQQEHVPGTPLGTIGGIAVEHLFPVSGTYRFEPRLYRNVLASVRGLEFPNALEVTIDKVRVHYAEFGGLDDHRRTNVVNAYAVADEIDARLAFETAVTAGPRVVAISFIRKPPAQSIEVWRPFRRQLIDANEDKGLPHLHQVDITGPMAVAGVGDTPGRREVFTCEPQTTADETPCAVEILSTLARRAWRRPVAQDEVDGLMAIYRDGRGTGTFDQGIEKAIRRIISGAEFVFRTEALPQDAAPGQTYRIADLDLASRLSFFLWSSIPDEELLSHAINGDLSEPRVLESQLRRMLQDEKFGEFVRNFSGQWLTLRNLPGIVPDPGLFPDFDDNLRQALGRETELLFDAVVRENRSLVDMLDADFTFLNERLARHYGIPGIYGERFRRVAIQDPDRRGILGQASFLTLTSVATRASPVTRGKWILENLLGMPPPSPPPDVPSLDSSARPQPQTLREQMTRHRADPVCAACHRLMDPFGFALENFDAVGRWRATDQGFAIDAADTMFDGSHVDGPAELRAFLLSKREVFVATFLTKLMMYALGRRIEPGDMPSIRTILRDTSANDYRVSDLMMGLIASPAFQTRTAGLESAEPGASVASVLSNSARR